MDIDARPLDLRKLIEREGSTIATVAAYAAKIAEPMRGLRKNSGGVPRSAGPRATLQGRLRDFMYAGRRWHIRNRIPLPPFGNGYYDSDEVEYNPTFATLVDWADKKVRDAFVGAHDGTWESASWAVWGYRYQSLGLPPLPPTL